MSISSSFLSGFPTVTSSEKKTGCWLKRTLLENADKNEKQTISSYVYKNLKREALGFGASIRLSSLEGSFSFGTTLPQEPPRLLAFTALCMDLNLLATGCSALGKLLLIAAAMVIKLPVDIFAGGFIYETKKQWAKAVALDLALLLSTPLMGVTLCLVIVTKIVWDVLCFLPRLILGIPCLPFSTSLEKLFSVLREAHETIYCAHETA